MYEVFHPIAESVQIVKCSNCKYANINGSNLKKLINNTLKENSSIEASHMKNNKLLIYSHNLSGAKSKIYQINNFLAITNYEVICLQETWFNDSVTNEEILASTNFNANRSDRHTFINTRKNGGGIITFAIMQNS